MKQFIACLLFTLLFHLLSSFLGGNFNPMEWGFETEHQKLGKMLYLFVQFCIWIVPITLNYLNGDKNFKD